MIIDLNYHLIRAGRSHGSASYGYEARRQGVCNHCGSPTRHIYMIDLTCWRACSEQHAESARDKAEELISQPLSPSLLQGH